MDKPVPIVDVRPDLVPIRLLGWILIFSILGSSCLAIAQDQIEVENKRNDDSKLLDGLRRRRLFESAEYYCRDQLAQSNIDPTSQVLLVVELMKTQTAKAVLTEIGNRDSEWRAVATTAAEFLQSNPAHPRKFLVQVQLALSHIAHGRLLRQELDADMAGKTTRNDALAQLKTARTLLGSLRREISNAIPNQRGRTLTEHELTSAQLLNLNNNIQYQLAVCNLNRAQLHEVADRLNRIDALNNVGQQLMEVQRSTSEGQPLWWKTKLGQIECLRLLGSLSDSRRLAEAVSKLASQASNSIHVSLLEQKVRLATELGDEQYSQSVMNDVNDLGIRTAQLDLALIELAINLAARSTSEARKLEWSTFASDLSGSIERTYGGYWGRRADLILIAATGIATDRTEDGTSLAGNPSNSGTNNGNLNLLIRLADEAARKQLWDDAFKAYDRAAQLALSVKAYEQALKMDVRAGKILEKKGKHVQAAQRLTTAAIRNDQLALAPSAHLVGCWNSAKAMKTDQPQQRRDFQELLLEHIRRWPSATSADQARVWLAREYQSEKKWELALKTLLPVANDSPHLKSAIEQAVSSLKQVLHDMRESGNLTASKFKQLIEMLSKRRELLQSVDPLASRLLLAEAELDLVYGSRWPDSSLVASLIPIESSSDESLANNARAIHAVSISVEERENAKNLVAQIAHDESALRLCERCLAAVSDDPQRKNRLDGVNELRLAVCEHALALPAIQKTENEANRTSWMIKQSAALDALERYQESIVVLTELESKYPRNAGVQMQLGRAFSRQFANQDSKIPLDKWRRIANRLKPHSTNWYEAKLEVARLLCESGDLETARKLLKYIQVTPPGWENSPLKPEFEKLLKRSQRK